MMLGLSIIFLLSVQSFNFAYAEEPRNERVVVLIAEFPDRKFGKSIQEVEDHMEEVNAIFQEASLGKLSIDSRVVQTKLMVDRTISFYDRGSFNNVPFLQDVVTMADQEYDVDFDNSWALIFHAGRVQPTGSAIYTNAVTEDGERILGFARMDATFLTAVTVHELAHLFGRIPDLYDRTRPVDDISNQYQSDVYYYDMDLMGAKTHGGFSAFSRMKLGWLDGHVKELDLKEEYEGSLTPVDACTDGICAIKIDVDHERYYLIEVRESIDSHPILQPGFEGLMVSYVDESIPSGRGPVRLLSVNGNPTLFIDKHPSDPDLIFASREHGFAVRNVGSDAGEYMVRIENDPNASYHEPKPVRIMVGDFMKRPQGGVSIDISKGEYIVARLRTDHNGIANFQALLPGVYGATLDNCFRCVGPSLTVTFDPSEQQAISITINEFMFQLAIILIIVIAVAAVLIVIVLKRNEEEARKRMESMTWGEVTDPEPE